MRDSPRTTARVAAGAAGTARRARGITCVTSAPVRAVPKGDLIDLVSLGALVGDGGERHDLAQTGDGEAVGEGTVGPGGVAAAPGVAGQPPADLDGGREVGRGSRASTGR
ncbi:hypothetical protein Arub01_18980 [Actinomadura rubrobrunea]|uniref:Uncharacterized protein n=1 Tax=Actinomadura rubrobrunea TaxID=115335 RepID=A0A9W6PV58_9ACTN|nr:hypothetical protein Arub01_18980 [Actinomadura rubrobrunea]